MSTLSDLVLAQGRSSQADVDWLHMLVGDLQLLADLAFADIVLWVPSGDDGFVAVSHARPSSAATLFYRDFVGQSIRPEWRAQVSEAFRTAHIVDSSTPDWYEEMPTRVRAVPVMRRLSATGTARTRVGISSYQSGAEESTIAALVKASVTRSRHCDLMPCPTKSR